MAGGLAPAIERARRIGAEALQVFPSNPRQWRRRAYGSGELVDWGDQLRRAGLPLFVHTIYLINLASPDRSLRARSAAALADALRFGTLASSQAVVTHIGSHRGAGFDSGLRWVADAVSEALTDFHELSDPAAVPPPLLLEASAGAKSSLGATPAEMGRILAELPDEAGACLDTAHLYAAGFPIHTQQGFEDFLAEMDRCVGLHRIGLVHLNDSRSALGSRADRHENLWEGNIGKSGLALWIGARVLQRVCFVIETPGFADEGPDRRNLFRAKRLRKR
jgi:deoxyribonuclease-4